MTKADIYQFIAKQKLGVLGTLSSGGSPQSALVGIAVTPELEIIFDTVKNSRKFQNLMSNSGCSFVACERLSVEQRNSGSRGRPSVWPTRPRYTQRRAAQRQSRIVAIGQLVLFSTETGDALVTGSLRSTCRAPGPGWRSAIGGDRGDRYQLVAWKGRYRIDGPAFTYAEKGLGRVRTILGYPTRRIKITRV
jgi:hypothetical protein